MTMMSIESIELETQSSKGSVFVDQEAIQKEYKRVIDLFDRKYNESELKNDAAEVAKGVRNIFKDKQGT